MIKIFVAVPSLGSLEAEQTYALRRIEKKYKDKIEFHYPRGHIGRIFHDYARNCMTDEFITSGCDIMWFLDSDVIPPDDILDLVTEHGDKWQLAGAVYPVWIVPPGFNSKQIVYTVYRDYKNEGKLAASVVVPNNGQDFVEGIATGCIFIKRHVFEKLSKPYFEFKYNSETRDIIEGEDLGFCLKVNKLGLKFFVDFSMVCHHMKKVSLLEVNNYAIEFAQKSVLANDRAIRQAIAQKKLQRLQSVHKSNLILPK